MKKHLKKFFTDSCIIFTVFVFILYIVGTLTLSNTITLTLKTAALLFVCCLLLRLLHNVLYIKSIPMICRILLHYILVVSAAYIGFAIIAKIISNSLASIVMLSAVTLIYSAFAIALFLISSKQKEKENEKQEYQSIFKK